MFSQFIFNNKSNLMKCFLPERQCQKHFSDNHFVKFNIKHNLNRHIFFFDTQYTGKKIRIQIYYKMSNVRLYFISVTKASDVTVK